MFGQVPGLLFGHAEVVTGNGNFYPSVTNQAHGRIIAFGLHDIAKAMTKPI